MFRWNYLLVALIFITKFSEIKCQTCANNQCPKSSFDVNLVVSPDKDCYSIGDDVTLTCSGNLGGPPSNTCNGNGGPTEGWDLPTSTICEVFTCTRSIGEALSLIPDKPSYDAREMVTYSCIEGYRLNGPTTAVCDGQDTWNPSTVPTCSAMCVVPEIPNGNVTGSGPFYDGDTADLVCDDGYSLEPGSSSTLSCQDGVWDSIPQCFASCDVPDVSNGDVITSGPFMHGQTAEVDCDEGYTLDGISSNTITCQDGAWDPVPDCYASCDVPDVSNGDVITSGPFMHGQTAEVDCDEGYTLDGISSNTITCQDGAWDPVPDCYASCDVPDVSNGDVITSGPFMHGQTAEVDCDEGYTLDGISSNTITCQDGAWDPVPDCYGSCYMPVIPNSDAETERQLIHGTDTSIHCEAGYSYELQTTFDVTCNNGTFEGDFPDECYQDCEEPMAPMNGSVTFFSERGNRHGETISYGCMEGFVLNGTESATCTNGSWSNDTPTCYEMIITCGAPEGVEEGLVLTQEKTSYNVNEVLKYSCSEGKTLKGPEESTCSASGDWQPPAPPVCHGEMIRITWSSFIILSFSSLLALYLS